MNSEEFSRLLVVAADASDDDAAWVSDVAAGIKYGDDTATKSAKRRNIASRDADYALTQDVVSRMLAAGAVWPRDPSTLLADVSSVVDRDIDGKLAQRLVGSGGPYRAHLHWVYGRDRVPSPFGYGLGGFVGSRPANGPLYYWLAPTAQRWFVWMQSAAAGEAFSVSFQLFALPSAAPITTTAGSTVQFSGYLLSRSTDVGTVVSLAIAIDGVVVHTFTFGRNDAGVDADKRAAVHVPFDVSLTVASGGVLSLVNPSANVEIAHGMLRLLP